MNQSINLSMKLTMKIYIVNMNEEINQSINATNHENKWQNDLSVKLILEMISPNERMNEMNVNESTTHPMKRNNSNPEEQINTIRQII